MLQRLQEVLERLSKILQGSEKVDGGGELHNRVPGGRVRLQGTSLSNFGKILLDLGISLISEVFLKFACQCRSGGVSMFIFLYTRLPLLGLRIRGPGSPNRLGVGSGADETKRSQATEQPGRRKPSGAWIKNY